MHLKVSLNISKKVALILLAILILAGAETVFYIRQSNKNPLPSNIKNQVSYKVIYPSETKKINTSSYNYQKDKKILSFNLQKNNNSIVFTEQPAPDNLGSGKDVYYPALGIHPYAQFKIGLGNVALTKFWQSSTLKPEGQSGVLASSGTFLIAHSEKSLTNAEWKNLFESLKITK
jgi:hypothetical protein